MWTLINRLYRRLHEKLNVINLSALIGSQQGRIEIELENIMRWEDDGGLIPNEVAKSIVGLGSNYLP